MRATELLQPAPPSYVVPEGALPHERLDARALSKLRWRCRRGLLENDLFIARFFERHAAALTVGDAEALGVLMDLSDNDLLDLLLARREPRPEDGLDAAAATRRVLAQLRRS